MYVIVEVTGERVKVQLELGYTAGGGRQLSTGADPSRPVSPWATAWMSR